MSFLVNTFSYRRKSLVDTFLAKYCNCQFFSIVIDEEEKAAEKSLDLASPSDVTKVVFIDASYMLVCGSIVSLIQ